MHDDSIEEWRPTPRGGGFYDASNLGRIRRSLRPGKQPGVRPGLVLKTRLGQRGYLLIDLHISGVRRPQKVHRLVAEAFIGPPPTASHTVNHKDGVKLNNRPENLEWATRKEQTQHAIKLGLFNPQGPGRGYGHPGTANGRAKLDDDDVRLILFVGDSLPATTVANFLGVSSVMVGRIRRGRGWAHVTPH